LGNLLNALKHVLGSGAQASFPTSVVEFAGKIPHILYVQNVMFGYQFKECQGAYSRLSVAFVVDSVHAFKL